jgi:NAD(P)-dependent dehydrogenase (short-subunit alcohol dehydrogenase family)
LGPSTDAQMRSYNRISAGIAASLNFGNSIGFNNRTFHKAPDKKLALTHLRACNDWHIDEPSLRTPVSEWERMFSVNFFGALRANAIVLPKMLARGQGYIVNTASFAGLYPYATNRIPYAASKAALVSMSETLAVYLHPKGIRVSCLCPGPTMTTSTVGMKPWSEGVIMRGPGNHLAVKSQDHAATVLADGMCAGRMLIPTHEEGWEIIRRRGSSPDIFIQEKIEAFARGDSGLPGR